MFPELGTLNEYEITIQLSLDGFSFATYNVNNQIFTHIERYDEPSPSLEKAISTIQEKYACNISDFKRVTVVFDNCANTFVPSAIFQNQDKDKFIDFIGIGGEGKATAIDYVSSVEANNLFTISSEDTALLADIQTDTRFHHSTSVLLSSIIKENIQKNYELAVYLNVKSPKFDMFVTKGCNLLFHNTFSFKTKEDFLYFLLFSIDQLHIDADAVSVYFMGMIEEKSQIVELASRYIRDIRFVRRNNNMNFSEDAEKTPYFYNYLLFNSITCEL